MVLAQVGAAHIAGHRARILVASYIHDAGELDVPVDRRGDEAGAQAVRPKRVRVQADGRCSARRGSKWSFNTIR
jgi:hypothetical protein